MKKITMQVPKNYNNGEAVESIFFEAMTKKILKIAGGFTQRETEGFWMSDSGKVMKDSNLEVTVVTDEKGEAKLRELASEIAVILKQECVYFESQEAKVEFVEPAWELVEDIA